MSLKDIAARQRAGGSSRPANNPLNELRRGVWLWETQLRHFNISHADALDAWVTGAASQSAQDPCFDPSRGDLDNVYRRYALHCYANGWSVIPEERSGGRKPAQITTGKNKLLLKVLPSLQRDVLPRLDDVFTIADRSVGDNVAVVAGPASSHVRAFDIDCLDEELSMKIREIAFDVFGETPFIRIGRWPKQLLVYRAAADAIAIGTIPKQFVTADGKRDPDNAIEYLSAGRNFTMYGIHHKTGRTFDHSQGSLHPAVARPDAAPEFNLLQLNEFWRRAEEVRPFASGGGMRNSSPAGSEATFAAFSREPGYRDVDFWMPRTATGDWLTDDDGMISDGREQYLFKSAWAVAAANIQAVYGVRADGGRQMTSFLVAAFQRHAQSIISNHDGKYTAEKLDQLAAEKLRAALTKWSNSFDNFNKTGEYLVGMIPRKILEDGRAPSSQHLPTAARPADGSLDWLPEIPSAIPQLSNRSKSRAVMVATKTAEQLAADRNERALLGTLAEHEAVHNRVSDEIDAAASEFITAVERYAEPDLPPLHILMAPTGSGKTTRTVAAIGEWCRQHPRNPGDGPIIVCLPTHANIGEAMVTAQRNGMVVPEPSELDEETVAGELRALGVKAWVLKGKERAGCQRTEEIKALRDAGIGASSLCGTRLDDENEIVARATRRKGEKVKKTEVLCEFRERGECGYWNQMNEIATADIVFVPHSYLTMPNPPKAIKKARAVIVDESIVYRVLHQMRMPLDVLDRLRPEPRVTKSELGDNGDREEIVHRMLSNREAVAAIAKSALLSGKCPAAAIRDAGKSEAVSDAIKICSRAHTAERELSPRMTREQVLAMADEQVRHGHLIEEEKFWRLIGERIDMLEAGTATGDREMRLQLVQIMTSEHGLVPNVRMSWRSQPNWSGSPMLLLDASASPKIMAKTFGREATVHEISAPSHVRTIAVIDRPFANRAFMPPADADDKELAQAKCATQAAQALVDKVSSVYAHSRVLVGSTVGVRQHLASGEWTPPVNVDSVHFGALRGLDFAKNHAAAISVGRSEQPMHVIDGYVAALTYDDPEPEQPYDLRGDGFVEVDGKLKPLFRKGAERVIKMRTGHDVSHFVPEMPGAWAKELEGQWREEELRQFVGRLRPVYRGADEAAVSEPPVWICVSKSLPCDIIVDEIVSLEDLVKDAPFWAMMRLTNGVFAPSLISTIPEAVDMLSGGSLEQFVDRHLSTATRKLMVSKSVVIDITIDGRRERALIPASSLEDPLAVLQRALPGVAIEVRATTPGRRAFDGRAKAKMWDWVDLELSAPPPAPAPEPAPVAASEEYPSETWYTHIDDIHRMYRTPEEARAAGDKIRAERAALLVAETAPTIAGCSRSQSTLTPKGLLQPPTGSTVSASGPRSLQGLIRRPTRSVASSLRN